MEKRRHEYNQGKKDAVLPFQHAVPAALTLTNTDYQMKTTRIMNKIIIYLSAVLLLCKTLCSVSIWQRRRLCKWRTVPHSGPERAYRLRRRDRQDRHPSSFCLRLSIRGWQGESHRFGGTERGGRLRQRALVLGKWWLVLHWQTREPVWESRYRQGQNTSITQQ